MMTKKEIGQRLKEARRQKGLSQTEVAEHLGVGQNSISGWEQGHHLPTYEVLAQLAAYLEIDDLVVPDVNRNSELLDDVVHVPEFAVTVSAGAGAFAADDDPIGHWPFPRRFFESMGRLANQFVMLTVWGDSMEPTLRSGDKIIIDTKRINPAQPGIYVIALENVAVVKRLDMIPGKKPAKLRISSDNPLHQAYEAPASDIRVIGWVAGVISTM